MSIRLIKRAAAAALALIAAGAAAAEEGYKIGFNAPLTGFAAADGNSARIGAELAVEQVNAAGGVGGKMLELVVIDDQADPKQAVSGATKLIEADGVVIGISGSYSGATRASVGAYQAAGRPYISAFAVHPDITRAGDFVFRTSFVGEILALSDEDRAAMNQTFKAVSDRILSEDPEVAAEYEKLLGVVEAQR